MMQPGWRDVVFSIKTFGAAVLALYIAFALDLTQPTWAMLTVFVVSQPIAGMVVAKALFRVVGTVVGASVALILVSAFAQSSSLFLISLALWIGACTFTSVLLRDAPAAYGAMLSGYTAAIVGIPAALTPETAFDYAIGRCVEITLGIGCATLISQVIFPRTAGESLKTSVNTSLHDAAIWTRDVFTASSGTRRSSTPHCMSSSFRSASSPSLARIPRRGNLSCRSCRRHDIGRRSGGGGSMVRLAELHGDAMDARWARARKHRGNSSGHLRNGCRDSRQG